MRASMDVYELRRILCYNRETGVFHWRITMGQRAIAGNVAGHLRDGYVRIGINGRQYSAHRLAWLYVTGQWPDHDLDHKNTDRADNRFNNLRPTNDGLNQQNLRKARSTNRLGILGVKPHGKRFVARICVAGRYHHIGVFDTPLNAHAAYVMAKRRLHEACTL